MSGSTRTKVKGTRKVLSQSINIDGMAPRKCSAFRERKALKQEFSLSVI